MTEKCCCVKETGETVNVRRFLQTLDKCFSENDLPAAQELVAYWTAEARRLGDDRGLLSVVNETLGLTRRTGDEEAGLAACREAEALLERLRLSDALSAADIYVNIATTMSCFGKAEEGLPRYDRAERILRENGKAETYDFAALRNNKATALEALGRLEEAEVCYRTAVDILRREGAHDGDIAVTLIGLAHLVYDRNEADWQQSEALLDEAWEYLNSPRQVRDGSYAYILTKCAPSLRYFHREVEAEALEAVAREIYGGAAEE